jgi:hypothetical protein
MRKNSSPKLRLATDDTMSASSCLQVSVCKILEVIEIEHTRQHGSVEHIHLFTEQVDKLVEFLQKSKVWIESGYKPELKPESFEEGGTEWFKRFKLK